MIQTHTIQRLTLDLQLPAGMHAMPLQEQCRVLCSEALAPLLEAVFNELAPAGEVLHIARLEIDLGTLTLEALQNELPALVAAYIRDRYNKPEAQLPKGATRIALPEAHFTYWLQYLQKGTLPAHTTALPAAEWEQVILETLSTSSSAVARCREILQQPTALKRLVLQNGGAFLQQWIGAFGGGQQQSAFQYLQNWESVLYESDLPAHLQRYWQGAALQWPVRAAFRELLYTWFIREQLLTGRVFDHVKILEAMLRSVLNKAQMAQWLFLAAQAPAMRAHAILLQSVSTLQAQLHPPEIGQSSGQNVTDTTGTAPKNGANGKGNTADPNITPTHTRNYKTDDETPTGSSQPDAPTNDTPENVALYVQQAGLVLLHPFLQAFFKDLELLEGRAFRDNDCRDKAVHLLQFLASGEQEAPDHALILPKLLCGLSPADPMQRFVSLSEAEQAAAQSLLQDVIEHWNALGHTSPDGLRGNFLQREGRLLKQDAEWRLRVSQQAYDLLLSRLPWSYSIIKLPWMPLFLKTEWA